MKRFKVQRKYVYAGAVLAAVGVGVYLYRNRPVRTQQGREDLESRLSVLNPLFAARIRTLMGRMERRGFDPMIWETGRSRERAEDLAERGTGIEDSMHIYGLAVDIVSASALWGAPQPFWRALCEEANYLKLTCGADFGDHDHIQALPTRYDPIVRRSTPAEIRKLLRQQFA